MSSICYRDGILCCDTGYWRYGYIRFSRHRHKAMETDFGLIAAVGYSTDLVSLLRVLEGDTEIKLSNDFSGMLITDTKLYEVHHDKRFREVEYPFLAIGPAAEFMYGALFHGATAEEAVKLAIEHTDHAVSPISFHTRPTTVRKHIDPKFIF